MGWRETCPMRERLRLVHEFERGELSVAELCRRFGISRQTGHKWLLRWRESGGDPESLRDLSRAPLAHPNRMGEEARQAALAARRAHPSWGPKKVRQVLARQGVEPLPAASSIGELLSREGLVAARRERRHATPTAPGHLSQALAPHDVACMDFKGWWRTGDGRRFGPFTLTDQASRYVVRAQALGRDDEAGVRGVLTSAWRQWGLPAAVRSDNGSPFASTGLGGLTRLSAWMMRLGVVAERIEPARPDQNGQHERMHGTMASEVESRPARDRAAQQRELERWRREFNEERPHEALGQRTPAEFFGPSPRPWTGRLMEPGYPPEFEERRVEKHGQVKWLGQRFYATQALAGELVGLRQDDERWWTLYFMGLALARLDGWHAELHPLPGRKPRRPGGPPPPPAVEMWAAGQDPARLPTVPQPCDDDERG